MKSKLLMFIIIVCLALSIFVPAIAASKVVDITRPEGNEVVTKDVFSICGVCVFDDTTIELQYKDRDTGEYKPLLTSEGDSSFKVGSNKLFGKDIVLKYKGDNEIRVIAYTKTNKELKEYKEVKDYTITLAEEKKKSNWFEKALTWFGIEEKK